MVSHKNLDFLEFVLTRLKPILKYADWHLCIERMYLFSYFTEMYTTVHLYVPKPWRRLSLSTNSSLPSQQPSQGDFQILECGETKRIVEVYFDCRYYNNYMFCAFRHFLQARRWQSHTENPSRESLSVARRLRYVIISKVNFAKQELTTSKQRLRWFGRRQAADSSFKARWRLNQQTIGPNDAGDVATDSSLRWS